MNEASERLRLLSYNIHGCIGRDGVEDAERVLDVIRTADADVVSLQEVYDLDDADRSFLRGLEQLNYDSVIYGQTMRKEIGHYGNILMTRRRPTEFERIDLSVDHAEPRGAIRARLPFGEHGLSLMVTHLGLGAAERQAQLDRLFQIYREAEGDEPIGPRILMGDLNEWWPMSYNLFSVRKRYARSSEWPTFPSFFPVFALDRICVDNFPGRIVYRRPSHESAKWASDHCPIQADLFPE